MAFVTRQETTWRDLNAGDRIVDKNGDYWIVLNPQPIVVESVYHIRTMIKGEEPGSNDTKSVVVVKPATDTVTVIREGRLAADTESSAGTWEPKPREPELEQDKAVIEAAMGPTTEILPVIDTALELRSHLNLLHGDMIHEATTRAALLEHHRQSEKLEAAGKSEPGYVPHIHEEDK